MNKKLLLILCIFNAITGTNLDRSYSLDEYLQQHERNLLEQQYRSIINETTTHFINFIHSNNLKYLRFVISNLKYRITAETLRLMNEENFVFNLLRIHGHSPSSPSECLNYLINLEISLIYKEIKQLNIACKENLKIDDLRELIPKVTELIQLHENTIENTIYDEQNFNLLLQYSIALQNLKHIKKQIHINIFLLDYANFKKQINYNSAIDYLKSINCMNNIVTQIDRNRLRKIMLKILKKERRKTLDEEQRKELSEHFHVFLESFKNKNNSSKTKKHHAFFCSEYEYFNSFNSHKSLSNIIRDFCCYCDPDFKEITNSMLRFLFHLLTKSGYKPSSVCNSFEYIRTLEAFLLAKELKNLDKEYQVILKEKSGQEKINSLKILSRKIDSIGLLDSTRQYYEKQYSKPSLLKLKHCIISKRLETLKYKIKEVKS